MRIFQLKESINAEFLYFPQLRRNFEKQRPLFWQQKQNKRPLKFYITLIKIIYYETFSHCSLERID